MNSTLAIADLSAAESFLSTLGFNPDPAQLQRLAMIIIGGINLLKRINTVDGFTGAPLTPELTEAMERANRFILAAIAGSRVDPTDISHMLIDGPRTMNAINAAMQAKGIARTTESNVIGFDAVHVHNNIGDVQRMRQQGAQQRAVDRCQRDGKPEAFGRYFQEELGSSGDAPQPAVLPTRRSPNPPIPSNLTPVGAANLRARDRSTREGKPENFRRYYAEELAAV